MIRDKRFKKWYFQGEVDKDGLAMGWGIAISESDYDIQHEGTFLDDKFHGIGKC